MPTSRPYFSNSLTTVIAPKGIPLYAGPNNISKSPTSARVSARAVAKTDKVEPDERSEELKKYGDCRPDWSVNEPNFKAPTDIAWVMRLAWEALSVAAMVSGGGGQGSKILRSARRPGSWSGHSHLLNAINEATIIFIRLLCVSFPTLPLIPGSYVAYCIQH